MNPEGSDLKVKHLYIFDGAETYKTATLILIEICLILLYSFSIKLSYRNKPHIFAAKGSNEFNVSMHLLLFVSVFLRGSIISRIKWNKSLIVRNHQFSGY